MLRILKQKRVIVIRLGDNKLDLYNVDGTKMRTFSVSPGHPDHPTPHGVFWIEKKRRDPEWVNPAKDGWGRDLPAIIPPGPDNPLGTRALNWTPPAKVIRIHGTSATWLLGYNVSKGCVRMSNPDVEWLFARVAVGTPIVVVQTSPDRVPETAHNVSLLRTDINTEGA